MKTRFLVIVILVILVAMYFLMHARIWPEPEPCDVGFEHYHFGFCGSNLFAISAVHADDGAVVSSSVASETDSSGQINWNVGKIQWLEPSYPPSGTGVVRIIDPDMNLNPEKVDNFNVDVWSDSNTKGFALTATETGISTGVFESTVFLSLNYDACCNRLKVTEGDTVTAEYEDDTLPVSYAAVDVLRITTKSNIQAMLDSPLKQFKAGISVGEIQCKPDLVLIQKHDGSPACVKLDSIPKLIDRKWIGHISPQNIGALGLGYVSLYMLSDYADYGQKIAIDFSGPSLITEKIINYYDVEVLSRKITDDDKFSENFGTMTKQNMKEFFEKNPPSIVIKNGLSVFPLGGFKNNTGTYGPFNQFLSDAQLQELKKMFGD